MKKNLIIPVLIVYSFLAALTIIYFDGTGDSGDSYVHYQFAKFAPLHPKLYFNLWAKPVFVLLASPFALLGFISMKIFNTFVSLLNILFTYKIIKELKIKNALAGAVILICSPLCFVLTFSGFTEPLFALFICASIYLTLKKQFIPASIIISILPFVRSDGLIILSVFAFYFILKKEWKIFPLLLIGHVVYSISGFFIYHDLLWVFNEIPYARLSSNYGSGKLSHFVVQLLYVVGISIYILFLIGIISIIGDFLRRILSIEFQLLIFLGFLSFFIAHTLFWYFGIFNSMGLKGVLICVAPLISIISRKGFNFHTEEFFIIKMELTKDVINQTKSGDIVIWDNWYAPIEHVVAKEFLDSNIVLIKLIITNSLDNGGEVIYSVNKRK
jgi:Gpi18-like mannosyltransferase